MRGADIIAPPRELPRNKPPDYPPRLLQRNVEGTVRLEVLVQVDGSVGSIRVIDSSGHRLFDDAAVRAVGRWQFEPARQAGRPVAHRHIVECNFSIQTR
jgi:periplasmic protein TonB